MAKEQLFKATLQSRKENGDLKEVEYFDACTYEYIVMSMAEFIDASYNINASHFNLFIRKMK